MNSRVFLQALKERRLSILGWIAGIVALAAFLISVYPVLRGNEAVERLMASIPPALLATFGIDPDLYMTGVGFLEAQLFSFVGPLLLISFTLGVGASATAGEEEDGTIDLLLANPLSRRSLILQKFAAMAVLSFVIVLALALTVLAGNKPAGLELRTRGIVGIDLGLWLLGLLFGSIAMAIGAWSGRRLLAVGTGAALALLAFFCNGLAPLAEPLRGSEVFSPFHWYLDDHPALNGPTRGHLQLAVLTFGMVAVATLLFNRRNLCTESSPSRAKSGATMRRPSAFLRSTFGASLWERRRGLIWWMAGLYGVTAATMAFWPTIQRDPGVLRGIMDSIPKEIFAMFGISDPKVMLTAAGFLSARLYSSIALVLALAYGIGFGTRAIAGDERAGQLELLLGAPVSRTRLVCNRFAALVVLLAALCVGLAAVLAAGNAALDLGLATNAILGANVSLFLVALFFGAFALAIGAATGKPALARGIAITVAVGGFFLNGLGLYSPRFAPFRPLSPVAWYLGDRPPLTHGFHTGMLLLAAGTVVLVGVALFAVERRDLNR